MKKIIIFSIIFFALITQNCTKENKTEKIGSFPKKISLEGNVVESSLRASDLWIRDSIFISENVWSKENVFYTFNSSDNKLINTFGKRGKGPKEIRVPGASYYDKPNNTMYILDNGNNTIYKYDLKEKKIEPKKFIQIPSKLSQRVMEFEVLDTFNIVLQAYNKKNDLLLLINKNGNITKTFLNNPYDKNNLSKWTTFELYWNKIAKHPTKNIFVVAFRYFDRLMAVNLNKDSLLFDKVGPDFITHENIETYSHGAWKKNSKTKEGYFDIAVDNSFIYALYSGYLEESHKEADRIFVFNWEGKPVAKLSLDHELWYIAIDKKRELYGVTPKATKPLIRYKLPEFN